MPRSVNQQTHRRLLSVGISTNGSNERNEPFRGQKTLSLDEGLPCSHDVRLAGKGLAEQFPWKISVTGLAKHRLVPGRGQMVVLADPSPSETEVPDGVD